jgi:diguanylate cyclase (GGDEF)-like protein
VGRASSQVELDQSLAQLVSLLAQAFTADSPLATDSNTDTALGTPLETDTAGAIAGGADFFAGAGNKLPVASRWYQMLDRLLRHLDILAGEARDTWWLRSQLNEIHDANHAQSILDQLEQFLVAADRELAKGRDAELRALAYTRNQCEELIEHAVFASSRLTDIIAQLASDTDQSTSMLDATAERLRLFQRDLDRAEDRLRVLERKLNELHSGLRSRVDLVFKDVITGVYKAEGLAVRCSELHARWQRARSPLAVIVLAINATGPTRLSPLSQDELMRQSALAIESRIRISDVLARTGDHEFVLLLPDTDAGGAQAFCSRMVVALETAGFTQYGENLVLAVAAGLTAVKEGDDSQSFITRARGACEEAIQREHSMVVH